MVKQVYYLTKLQICNLFGINEARFSRDPKRRKSVTITFIAYLILGAVLIFYAAGLSVAFTQIGLAEVVPIYLALLSTVMIFGLTVFRAGALFSAKSYENFAVLPVSQSAIVASKFLTQYIVSFLFAFLVMASGGIACGALVGADLWFYFSILLSGVFLPLLPMTVALCIGTLIYAIVSRFKRKNLAHTLFVFAVLIATLVFPFFFDSNQTDAEFLTDIAAMIFSVGEIFRPILWFSLGVKLSGLGYYLLFVGVSVAVFAAFSLLVGRFYKNICSALLSNATKGNFTVGAQKKQSALIALYKRDMKRYLSSSIYFTNTVVGNIILLIISVAILFLGVENFIAEFGVSEKFIFSLLPFLLGLILNLTPSTTSAVSMEGKGWELTKGLPVSAKTVMDAKLTTHYTFALPTAIISEILLCIALKPTGLTLVWILILPVLYALFGGVSGLYINIKNPLFNWDNEITPVKQSSAVLLSMLIDLVSVVLPLVAVVLLPIWAIDYVIGVSAVCVGAVTVGLYKKIISTSLNSIDEK